MNLIIDKRESKIIDFLKNTNGSDTLSYLSDISVSFDTLDLGDIHIVDSSKNIVAIFERKTISDLLSSIKDKRYAEQSLRLSSSNTHNHNIYYIIEGPLLKSHNHNLIYSTLCSISYFKGFSLLRTYNIQETIHILHQFCIKINKDMDKRIPYYSVEQSDSVNNVGDKKQNDIDYCSTIKSSKKENITPDNIMQIFLMQIPQVSDKSAKAIAIIYPKLHLLLNIINNNSDELFNIKMTNHNTGKSRKISKNTIMNIIHFLKDTV
jgi:ERCC4-type nuclease